MDKRLEDIISCLGMKLTGASMLDDITVQIRFTDDLGFRKDQELTLLVLNHPMNRIKAKLKIKVTSIESEV